MRIGVARDRAFSFYYEDNLDLLREQGGEIIPFLAPSLTAVLPADLDAFYFGGGDPELYAPGSSEQIRRCSTRSGPSCDPEGHVYAGVRRPALSVATA